MKQKDNDQYNAFDEVGKRYDLLLQTYDHQIVLLADVRKKLRKLLVMRGSTSSNENKKKLRHVISFRNNSLILKLFSIACFFIQQQVEFSSFRGGIKLVVATFNVLQVVLDFIYWTPTTQSETIAVNFVSSLFLSVPKAA